MDLTQKVCVACEGGVTPFTKKETDKYLAEAGDWRVAEDYKKIFKEFRFKDFAAAMQFVNKVAEIAERERHHPDIHIFYNKVKIELWTHAIGGLSENDFILAAKTDTIAV